MLLTSKTKKRKTFNAFPNKAAMNTAKDYIKNRVNGYFQTESSDFCVRKLFGGSNGDWHGTPLQVLYDYYYQKYKSQNRPDCHEKAIKQAAKDVGALLIVVLDEAPESFVCTGYRNQTNWYNKK